MALMYESQKNKGLCPAVTRGRLPWAKGSATPTSRIVCLPTIKAAVVQTKMPQLTYCSALVVIHHYQRYTHGLTTHPMDINNHIVQGHAVRDPIARRREVDVPNAGPAGVHNGSPTHQAQLGPIEQAFLRRLYEVRREALGFDGIGEQRRIALEDLYAIYQRIGTTFAPGREDDGDQDGSEGGSDDEDADKENIVRQDPHGGYPAVSQDLTVRWLLFPGAEIRKEDEGISHRCVSHILKTDTLLTNRGPAMLRLSKTTSNRSHQHLLVSVQNQQTLITPRRVSRHARTR